MGFSQCIKDSSLLISSKVHVTMDDIPQTTRFMVLETMEKNNLALSNLKENEKEEICL